MVEVLRLAADIDHAVDRTRTTEHAAARIVDDATISAGIGLGLEAPGERRMVPQLRVASRDVDQRVPVAPAGLDQHDAGGGIFRQPIGQYAASRTGADDDVVSLQSVGPPVRVPFTG